MADVEWPLGLRPETAEFWLEWATSRTESTFTRQQQVMGRPSAERWRAKLSISGHKQKTALALDALMTSMKGGIQTVLMPDFRRLGPASPEYRSYRDWAAENDDLAWDTGSWWDTQAVAAGALLTEDGRRILSEVGEVLQAEVPPGLTGSLCAEDGSRILTESGAPIGVEDVVDSFVFGESEELDAAVPQLLDGVGDRVTVGGLAPEIVAFLPGDLIETSSGRVHEVAEAVTSDADGIAVLPIRPRLRTAVAPRRLAWPARARMRIDSSAAGRNPTRAPVVSSYEIDLTEDLNP